jgi:hypothetical protein
MSQAVACNSRRQWKCPENNENKWQHDATWPDEQLAVAH